MAERRILIVDDEASIREVVAQYLEREGYRVTLATNGEMALEKALAQPPDLVILDLMLPKLSGMEVFQRLRASSPVPVIMLTARGEETDRIVGLEIGADDYITKPFSPRELVARVKAVLRRSETVHGPAMTDKEMLRLGDLSINPRTRSAQIGERILDLTAREFDLLWYLASHRGQVFTREQLLGAVWDYEAYGDASTVTVHVHRLREKVEADPMSPRYVKTVWGVGYKFEA